MGSWDRPSWEYVQWPMRGLGHRGKSMKRAPENKPLRKAAEVLGEKSFRCPWCQMNWAGCSNQNRWCSINKQADCWYQYCIEEASA